MANKQVDQILEDIIKAEGGFVNDPADAGGPTNMGITQKTLSTYLGRQASVRDVANLSKEQAKEIYERRYYVGPRFDTLPPQLQPIATDTGVLFGPFRSIEFMQKIVNEVGIDNLEVDGTLGPKTRKAIQAAWEQMGNYFINAMVDERITYHKNRVAQQPNQQRFLNGWIRRAEKFREPVE